MVIMDQLPLVMPVEIETAETVPVQIEKHLRRFIATNQWRVGQRLPPARELAESLGVEYKALHKALNRLKTVGLIERAPRRGTFVKSCTETVVIGVLFGPSLLEESAHSCRAFLQVLQEQVETQEGGDRYRCRAYDGLAGVRSGPAPVRPRSAEQLVADFKNYSFRGVIWISLPEPRFPFIPGLDQLPSARWDETKISDGEYDHYHFGYESMRFLAQKGRKRILLFRTTGQTTGKTADLDGVFAAAQECGLPRPQVEPIRFVHRGARMARKVYQQALTLFRAWPRRGGERPDALLVEDDIMMRAIARALHDTGWRVPDDLLVLCRTNEEVVLDYGFSIIRYDLPCAAAARVLLDVLGQRLRGESPRDLPRKVRGRIKEADPLYE